MRPTRIAAGLLLLVPLGGPLAAEGVFCRPIAAVPATITEQGRYCVTAPLRWPQELRGAAASGYKHVPRLQPTQLRLRQGAKSVVPLADRAIGNLKQWLHRYPPQCQPRPAPGLLR